MDTNLSTSRESSIYLLSDPITGKPRYVGVTCQSLKTRLLRHLNDKTGDHRGNWVKSLRKRGLKPIIETLEIVKPHQRVDAEQAWILGFRQAGADLVNSTDGGEGILNPSPETRAKLSANQKARHVSEETKAKLRAARAKQVFTEEDEIKRCNALKGRTVSEETRAKIAASKIGKPRSPEVRIKMRLARLGKHLSDNHKEKIRMSNLGRTASIETREKLRQANLGKKASDEARQNMRVAHLGKKLSLVTRNKMSVTHKLLHERKVVNNG